MAKKRDDGQYDIPKMSLTGDQDMVGSPIDEEGQLLWEAAQEEGDEVMLPPTVSTYSHRTSYVPPPPDQKMLKRDLVEALENALQSLEACEKALQTEEEPTQGFYEIQGLQVLDTTTLAIRAARLYYALHTNPKRLNAIRPDQQIRKELYDVLEVLKKCAGRNFAGGFREDERLAVLVWVSEVGMIIDQEAKLEEKERKERNNWLWLDDARWPANTEKQRELAFLDWLLREASDCLPPPLEPSGAQQSEFFRSLSDGRRLIRMHNAAVKRSKKQFGQIDKFHDDIAKPYRRADNVRYWLKAAELRWELKLKLDVMAVVNGQAESPAWVIFEDTVLQWSKSVRTELTKDWNGDEERRLHMRAKSLALASPFSSPSKPRRKNSGASSRLPVEEE